MAFGAADSTQQPDQLAALLAGSGKAAAVGENSPIPKYDPGLGTRLTIQALGESMRAHPAPLNLPADVFTRPLSPDLEDRTSTPNDTVAPPPSLMDRIESGLSTFGQKTKLAEQGIVNMYHGRDPYYQAPVDPNFYRPGHDAASAPYHEYEQQIQRPRH